MKIWKQHFGRLADETDVDLIIMQNADSKIKFSSYGASIVSLKVPDKKNNPEEITLGFENLRQYERNHGYYGAVVGRYGNRIANGKFTLNGKEYVLAVNEGKNHLHGGVRGFDRVVWKIDGISEGNDPHVIFSYLSRDGEEGYPGNLSVKVLYSFNDNHELKIKYVVNTDKTTIKNITNHAYFNLSGNLKTNILSHFVLLNADQFLPVDEGLIPTGEVRSVKDTPMDFLTAHKIGERINQDDIQLRFAKGYDQNWIIKDSKEKLKFAARIGDVESGRILEVYTTEPGLQFYSGNFLDGSHKGHNGKSYNYRDAFVVETQHYPDSPNHQNFPTTILEPGEIYESETLYKFLVDQ